MIVHGWGRYPSIDAKLRMPSTVAEVRADALDGNISSVIARGMGRSYGDSSLAADIVCLQRLNLLSGFDPVTGVVRCGAGVTLAELIEVFLPHGWFLPVTPGTKFVSVGGAIASDVHGKNHHGHGSFGQYVDSIVLLLGNGNVVRCSVGENAELFHATCGGMGLTGIVLEAELRLRRVESAYIEQTTFKTSSLEETLALFDVHHGSTYSVAWIDCLATGRSLGRSLVMLGEHASPGGLDLAAGARVAVPFDMPARLMNRYSIKAFNALYYRRVLARQSSRIIGCESFFYPLDGIRHWNRLYGKRGFVQYQFVLPREAGSKGMAAVLGKIAGTGRGSFLAVLKALGGANGNMLSFPLEGYTLALDFKLDDELFGLLEELDAMVLDYGGRLYLAKDARMSAATFRRGYPCWMKFQNVRERWGAIGKFASLQSRRLGLD